MTQPIDTLYTQYDIATGQLLNCTATCAYPWSDFGNESSTTNGTSGNVPKNNVRTPLFVRDNNYTMYIQFYNGYPNTWDISVFGPFRLGINKDYSTLTPMIESDNADFDNDKYENILGGYNDASIGRISVNINTHSAALTTDLGTSTQKSYHLEIEGSNAGSYTTMALFDCIIKNNIT